MKKIIFILLCVFIFIFPLYAAPPHPDLIRKGKVSPKKFKTLKHSVRSLPISRTARKAFTTGEHSIAVLLIEFKNGSVKHDSSHSKDYFNEIIFSTSTSSMYDYYYKNSYGLFSIVNSTSTTNPSDWVASEHTMEYYGEDNGVYIDAVHDIRDLIKEAIDKTDDSFDFSQFDKDKNGIVDHLIVVHAGEAQEATGVSSDIWSHRWQLYPPYSTDDGVVVGGYTLQSEYSPLGIFCHEFGHDIGLPDLYNTSTGISVVGRYALMDAGCWNGPNIKERNYYDIGAVGGGTSPSHISAWCKYILEWISPTLLSSETTAVEVNSYFNNKSNSCYKINIDANEYFLVTYRKQSGYDTHLPSEGLLIWHIDTSLANQTHISSNDMNANSSHPGVDLEGPTKLSPPDIGSPFTTGTSFVPPASNSYSEESSGISILNISGEGLNKMSFNLYVLEASVEASLEIKEIDNFPNPVTGSECTIRITFNKSIDEAELNIYNLAGERVFSSSIGNLYLNGTQSSDYNWVYDYPWKITNNYGKKVSSGLYFYTIKVDSKRKTGKIAIIR